MWFIEDGCGSRLNHRPDWLALVPGPEGSSGAIMWNDGFVGARRLPGLSSVYLGSSVMLQGLVREQWDPKVTINWLRVGVQRSGGSCGIEEKGERKD